MGNIVAPDTDWIRYIAQMWVLGSQISEDIAGQAMDGSLKDLERLQTIIDSAQLSVEDTQELQSLGIVFGKVFVNETPDYDWWVVEDEYGTDACVRYKETTLLVFPQTMLSKRLEDGEKPNVLELYQHLTEELDQIRNKHYADA